MTPVAVDVARVVGWQAVIVTGGLAVLVATPLGLGWALPVVALAWTFGGWAWAVRRPGAPDRARVRQVAARVGAGWGMGVTLAYVAIASRPGQVELEPAGVVLAGLVLGALGAAAAAGLSLCGIDATSRVDRAGGVESDGR